MKPVPLGSVEDDGFRDALQQALLRDGIEVDLQDDGLTLRITW